MKRILFIYALLLSTLTGIAQSIYPIRTDTVRVYTGSIDPSAGGELLLQNASRTVVNGVLTNINGRGNTVFRKLNLTNTPNITGSTIGITDQSSITIPWLRPYMDTMYFSGGNLLYQKNGNTYTVNLPTPATITASNYLSKIGNDISLGGSTTGSTSLNAINYEFRIQGNDNLGGLAAFVLNGSTQTGFQTSVQRGTTVTGLTNFYNTFDITSNTPGASNSLIRATPTQTRMEVNGSGRTTALSLSTTANLFADGINSIGLSYTGNYAANNTANARWLPDKNYVDSSISVSGGTTPSMIVGRTYDKSSWTNLSDFSVNTVGATVSAGKINIPNAGVTDFTKSLQLASYSCVNHWKTEIVFRLTQPISAATTGISVGTQSTNVNSLNSWAVFFSTSTTNTGRMEFFAQSNSGTWFSADASPNSLSFDAGDEIKLSIERNNQFVYIKAENLTYPFAEPVYHTIETDMNSNPIAPNTGHFSIWGQGGTFTVDRFTVYNNELLEPDMMFLGDSKTLGYGATSFYNTYPGQLGSKFNRVSISAGFGDKTTDLLNHIDEIKLINPKRVILAIGSNDERFGAGASFQTNYANIVNQLTTQGIEVYHLSPAYETGLDLTSQYNFVKATYPQMVDVFDLFKGDGNLYSDGIHWTDQGNMLASQLVLDSNYVIGVKTYDQFLPPAPTPPTPPTPNIQQVLTAGNSANIPGAKIELYSPSGTDGAQLSLLDVSGASTYLQSIPVGAQGWSQLILSGDSSNIIMRNDIRLKREFDSEYTQSYLRADGRFSGANATAANDMVTLTQLLLEATRTITTSSTLSVLGDRNIYVNNTTDITINLPAVTGIAGKTYFIKKIASNTNTITIVPTGGALIENSSNIILSGFLDYVVIKCEGTNWYLATPAP
jgi:hypothetical protein